MTLSSDRGAAGRFSDSDRVLDISTFPSEGRLQSAEQIRRFELLRLAFFVLKLRKLEQRLAGRQGEDRVIRDKNSEQEFRLSLLRHAIFQQVVTLIRLDAREQALQIIDACRK